MDSKKSGQASMIEIGILLSWAIFFLFVIFSHRLPLYINPKFLIVPLLGALIAASMAVAAQYGRAKVGCSDTRDWSLMAWFLMPVVMGLAVAPVGMGMRVSGMSSSAGNSSVFLNLAETAKYTPVTIIDLSNAGHITRGKVSVDGQLRQDAPGLHPGEMALMHYEMTCCVADLRPVFVIMKCPAGLKYANGSQMKSGDWIRVQGVVERNGRGVVLSPDIITPISEPNPPYLY